MATETEPFDKVILDMRVRAEGAYRIASHNEDAVTHTSAVEQMLRSFIERLERSWTAEEMARAVKEKIARDFIDWIFRNAENETWQTIRDKAVECDFNMNHPELYQISEEAKQNEAR